MELHHRPRWPMRPRVPILTHPSGTSKMSILFSVQLHYYFFTFSVTEGTRTVGEAVSKAMLDDLIGLELLLQLLEDVSSMDRDAMVPGAGANDEGMFEGGCCFFLIMSL
jgi:hypothetical protein